jgi:hypothetical protein
MRLWVEKLDDSMGINVAIDCNNAAAAVATLVTQAGLVCAAFQTVTLPRMQLGLPFTWGKDCAYPSTVSKEDSLTPFAAAPLGFNLSCQCKRSRPSATAMTETDQQ